MDPQARTAVRDQLGETICLACFLRRSVGATVAATGRSGSRAKAPAPSGRLKIVWAVKDPDGNIVKTYAYPQQRHAEAEAERLRAVHQRYYTVRKEKVPMD